MVNKQPASEVNCAEISPVHVIGEKFSQHKFSPSEKFATSSNNGLIMDCYNKHTLLLYVDSWLSNVLEPSFLDSTSVFCVSIGIVKLVDLITSF